MPKLRRLSGAKVIRLLRRLMMDNEAIGSRLESLNWGGVLSYPELQEHVSLHSGR
jgi:hypothetical protein